MFSIWPQEKSYHSAKIWASSSLIFNNMFDIFPFLTMKTITSNLTKFKRQ